MSMNCPVLVNRTSSLPEVCGDAAFYFDATSSEELARRLISTLGDSQGLARKRQLGLERVGLYDWQRSANRTLAVYRELLGA
jgi:glycosyltransferase involved in cell wall biosynthesis